MTTTALIVIDVQLGFEDVSFWGEAANPAADANISRLLEAWTTEGRGPVVVVRHDSLNPASPLHSGQAGNALKPAVAAIVPDLLVTKTVNSAFLGDPDLHQWLSSAGVCRLVLCGIQTNMCVETTARMGGNLGYDVVVPLDATSTFGLTAQLPDGPYSLPGTELMKATALNLQAGGFAQVTSTAAVLAEA